MSKRVRAAKQTEQSPPCKRLKKAAPLSTVADLVKHTPNFNELLKLNYDCFLNMFSYLSKEDLLALCVAHSSFRALLADSKVFDDQFVVDERANVRNPYRFCCDHSVLTGNSHPGAQHNRKQLLAPVGV